MKRFHLKETFYSGRELTHAHQYGIAAALSFPLFFVAGAGAAVFWVLGELLPFIDSVTARGQKFTVKSVKS